MPSTAAPARRGLIKFLDVVAMLGVHYNTGYTWLRNDEFPIAVQEIRGRYYCRQTDIDAYFAETGETPA